jgi:hypothetical protein
MKEALIYGGIFLAVLLLAHSVPVTSKYYNKLLNKVAKGEQRFLPGPTVAR